MKKILYKILHIPYFGPAIGFYMGIRGYNRVKRIITRANGKLSLRDKIFNIIPSFNSRVDAGAGIIVDLISGSNLASLTAPAVPKYLALGSATITAAKADTSLASEITVNGLARALGTIGGYVAPAALDGSASYTITHTWTATGTQTVAAAAVLDATSGGNLFVEANLSSSATLNANDTISLTWTVNF